VGERLEPHSLGKSRGWAAWYRPSGPIPVRTCRTSNCATCSARASNECRWRPLFRRGRPSRSCLTMALGCTYRSACLPGGFRTCSGGGRRPRSRRKREWRGWLLHLHLFLIRSTHFIPYIHPAHTCAPGQAQCSAFFPGRDCRPPAQLFIGPGPPSSAVCSAGTVILIRILHGSWTGVCSAIFWYSHQRARTG
jgi:hypothetical protein